MKTLRAIDEKLHSLWTCRFGPLTLTFPEKSGVCVCVSFEIHVELVEFFYVRKLSGFKNRAQ